MSEKLKITVLGSGTSQGVPVIGCQCDVCISTDSRDNRLRCSILISVNGENFVVDTGPDFRQQMLRENVTTLRAVLFTHEHKDHVAGLDDVRSFNFLEKRDMEIFCSSRVERTLKNEFQYAFAKNPYPGVPKFNLNIIDKNVFHLPDGPKVTPITVMHYKLPVHAFRIGDFTYITDAKTVSEEEKAKIKGSKVLIVNALRKEEHISHFNLEQALAFIEEMEVEQAYLTHISHLFGKHKDIELLLPKNVHVAYDGMKIEL